MMIVALLVSLVHTQNIMFQKIIEKNYFCCLNVLLWHHDGIGQRRCIFAWISIHTVHFYIFNVYWNTKFFKTFIYFKCILFLFFTIIFAWHNWNALLSLIIIIFLKLTTFWFVSRCLYYNLCTFLHIFSLLLLVLLLGMIIPKYFSVCLKRERERGRESVSSANNLVALGPQYLAVSVMLFCICFLC